MTGPTLKLHNGVDLPAIGLGVYQSGPDESWSPLRWQSPDIWSMMPRLLSASAVRRGGEMALRIITGHGKKHSLCRMVRQSWKIGRRQNSRGASGAVFFFAHSSVVRSIVTSSGGNVRFWNASASSKLP